MIHIDQEPDYVPKRPLGWSAVIAVVAILGSILATIGLVRGRVLDVLHVTSTSPARIETTPFEERTEAEQMRIDADLHLTTYGWVDRRAGLIHVPLSVAIDSYLERR